MDVVHLKERARGTTPVVLVDEGALLAVSVEDLAANGGGDAPFIRTPKRPTRLRCIAEPVLLEMRKEQVDTSLHDVRQVARRIAVSHQAHGAFELLSHLRADRQLNLVARGG